MNARKITTHLYSGYEEKVAIVIVDFILLQTVAKEQTVHLMVNVAAVHGPLQGSTLKK